MEAAGSGRQSSRDEIKRTKKKKRETLERMGFGTGDVWAKSAYVTVDLQ